MSAEIEFPLKFVNSCNKYELSAVEHSNYISLYRLILRKSQRNIGIGTEIIDFLKSFNKEIRLMPYSPEDRQSDLVRFYQNRGFVLQENGHMRWTPEIVK